MVDYCDKAALERMRSRLDRITLRIRKQFVLDLVNLKNLRALSVPEANEYYCLDFIQDAFNVLVLKILPKAAPHPDAGAALGEIEARMHRAFSGVFHEFETAVEAHRLVCVFNITTHRDSPETQQFKMVIGRFFSDISTAGEYADFGFVMGEGTPVTDLSRLPDCYDSAVFALEHSVVYGINRKYDSNDMVRTLGDLLSMLTPEKKSRMRFYVESLSRERLHGLIDALFQEGAALFMQYPDMVYRLAGAIIDICGASAGDSLPREALFDQELEGIRRELDNCASVGEVRLSCHQGAERLCGLYAGFLRERDRLPIATAKRFIQENYAGRLPLPGIAAKVGLNHQYLSVLFKKETGMSVTGYVAQIRVEQAKRLLSESGKTVQEIAADVGYADAKYFSRVFRAKAGMTPSEYRSACSRPL